MLMAAIDPTKTRLLLVGDSDQLPSVGAGNVLNELITCGKVPVTRLDLVYRQGSGSIIPVNAEKINAGDSKNFHTIRSFDLSVQTNQNFVLIQSLRSTFSRLRIKGSKIAVSCVR